MYDQYPAERGTGGPWITIRRNPVPATLAAIGLGLLWTNRANRSRGTYRARSARPGRDERSVFAERSAGSSTAGSSAQGQPIGEQVVEQVQQMREQVMGHAQHVGEHVADQAQHVAGQVPHQMQERAGQVQQQARGVWQVLETNPVAMGGLGVVLGGVAGLLLPNTEREHQLMGETRERVLDSVQEMAKETVAQVQRAAEDAGSAAMNTARTAMDELSASPRGSGETGKSSPETRGGSGTST